MSVSVIKNSVSIKIEYCSDLIDYEALINDVYCCLNDDNLIFYSFNLYNVDFINSTTLGTLIGIVKRLKELKKPIEFININNGNVRQLLTFAKLI